MNQHGAFLIDETPCSFEIINMDTARISTLWQGSLDKIIDEFREFAGHITKFIDEENRMIQSFEAISLALIPIEKLQPSQFFVNTEKLNAINQWLLSKEQVIIPAVKSEGSFIVIDGHTRLYAAIKKGIEEAFFYTIERPSYIHDFVKEAMKRNIYSIRNLQELPPDKYEKEWIGFCNNYFNK
ncbi:hypothetical protein [Anaeropeptidivorans aminofermentans]|uniref:hypothetical protein n=1 Tax=Anaeropeptidivorans aminofermentans TaxID=2934315 RepID=UPI0020257277|nr:hypothetical protein [Anaeropeptidivorans aminofermentans]